jgi:hypothetical protein
MKLACGVFSSTLHVSYTCHSEQKGQYAEVVKSCNKQTNKQLKQNENVKNDNVQHYASTVKPAKNGTARDKILF